MIVKKFESGLLSQTERRTMSVRPAARSAMRGVSSISRTLPARTSCWAAVASTRLEHWWTSSCSSPILPSSLAACAAKRPEILVWKSVVTDRQAVSSWVAVLPRMSARAVRMSSGQEAGSRSTDSLILSPREGPGGWGAAPGRAPEAAAGRPAAAAAAGATPSEPAAPRGTPAAGPTWAGPGPPSAAWGAAARPPLPARASAHGSARPWSGSTAAAPASRPPRPSAPRGRRALGGGGAAAAVGSLPEDPSKSSLRLRSTWRRCRS